VQALLPRLLLVSPVVRARALLYALFVLVPLEPTVLVDQLPERCTTVFWLCQRQLQTLVLADTIVQELLLLLQLVSPVVRARALLYALFVLVPLEPTVLVDQLPGLGTTVL